MTRGEARAIDYQYIFSISRYSTCMSSVNIEIHHTNRRLSVNVNRRRLARYRAVEWANRARLDALPVMSFALAAS